MQDGPLESCGLVSELLPSIQTALQFHMLVFNDERRSFPSCLLMGCCCSHHRRQLPLQPAATAARPGQLNTTLGSTSPQHPHLHFPCQNINSCTPRGGEQLGSNTKPLRNKLLRKGCVNVVLILYKTAWGCNQE